MPPPLTFAVSSRAWTILTSSVLLAGLAGCGESAPAPPLVASDPMPGAVDVPRSRWIRLDFATPPTADAVKGMEVECTQGEIEVATTTLGSRVVLNPRRDLDGGECEVRWQGPGGEEAIAFTVAGAGIPAEVPYNRYDPSRIAPVPDDVFSVPGDTPSGLALEFPPLQRPANVSAVLGALTGAVTGVDGFSPLTPIVVELPGPVDPTTIPTTPEASLHDEGSVMLIRLDEPERVPFYVQRKAETNAAGVVEHQLILFPGIPLQPGTRYGVVITREALIDPSRPLDPSSFTAAMLDPEQRSTETLLRVGALADEVLAAASVVMPPLEANDVALAMRFTTRTIEGQDDDLRVARDAIAEQYASSPPAFTIESVDEQEATSPIAAVVRGTWEAPVFADGVFAVRGSDGRPQLQGVSPIPFVLALPRNAPAGGAPVIMSQHGNPGSAEDNVPFVSRLGLAEAGFAVIGFTQPLDRGTGGDKEAVGDQLQSIFSTVLTQQRYPDTMCLLPNLEQLGFVQFLPALANLDVLPAGAPDGAPELDLDAPLGYLGVSYGSHNGSGMIAFAPEIKAAVLTVGGGRYFASIFHQDGTDVGASEVYATVTNLFPDVTRTELYVGLALSQTALDDQEWAHRHRYLFREPEGGAPRTSLLLTESLGDKWIPAFGTTTAAYAFGVPQVAPVHRSAPFLEVVEGPLAGNVSDGITGGFYQFVTAGVDGIPASPGCEDEDDGHRCAQRGQSAVAQRVHFFETALTGTPEIIDPLATP